MSSPPFRGANPSFYKEPRSNHVLLTLHLYATKWRLETGQSAFEPPRTGLPSLAARPPNSERCGKGLFFLRLLARPELTPLPDVTSIFVLPGPEDLPKDLIFSFPRS